MDITPHLLPDIHPWWQVLAGGPSSPIWRCWAYGCGSVFVNPLLYVTPMAGVPNPPGSYFGGIIGPFVFNYLDTLYPPAGATVFGPFGGPPTLDGFGAWCEAYATNQNPGQPDVFNSTAWQRPVRYSVEFSAYSPLGPGSVSNLQSFMVWWP